MVKYRISWTNKITGYEGSGEPEFSLRETAEREAKIANGRYPYIRHWVTPVDVSDKTGEKNDTRNCN